MSVPRPSEQRGEPNVVTLLTWFLPGAGHLVLGRVRMAALAFAVVQGLYALGWFLSDGRVFESLDPELRGPFATLLTPEVANLGAMILQMRLVGFGEGVPTPFPPGMALGGMLTSLSGMANVCFMVHANVAARTPASGGRSRLHPATLVGLSWVFPGLGHLAQGRRLRAAIVLVLLLGFFVVGTLLADLSNLSRERHFYYWSGQFLLGLPALVAELASGRPPVTGELPYGDVGLLYACMPGLLNILAMLDVYGVAEKRWLGIEPGPAADPAAAAPEEVAS